MNMKEFHRRKMREAQDLGIEELIKYHERKFALAKDEENSEMATRKLGKFVVAMTVFTCVSPFIAYGLFLFVWN
ncbi:hypothetical protein FEZ33_01365 [Ruoffia tabacinasalis]|uniref:Uncharacterized protein n=1 Tax=Ruoffia tabacinasalis TaxID=87458 RepID=A0A5R9ELU6_9LACT|nr:hypothetical protein [Ruoffia tabacinasalis]TLQ49308.1 hypothetical protein FEZ33_01365 [Ruoffia tabacinasalis]